jgi:nicotinamidase-related amidase
MPAWFAAALVLAAVLSGATASVGGFCWRLHDAAARRLFADVNPLSARTALVVVDVQQGLDDARYGVRNNPDAERRIGELLAAWRASGRPVVHTQHLSLNPDSALRAELPGCAIKPEAAPLEAEPVFQKHVNSAFIGTGLEAHLRERGIEELVVVGITTDHCVSTTVRMGANLGFRITVVEDATATFDRMARDGTYYTGDIMHRVNLASLDGEFATIASTSDVLAAANGGGQT